MSLVITEKIQPEIAHIILNRPEVRNALNIALLQELHLAIQNVKKDPLVRVLIITGNGPFFGSGLDLREALDESTSMQSSELFASVLVELYQCPFVTIAAVTGGAAGGGAGIMSSCDFAIAEKNSIFSYPEVKKGITAALVMVSLKNKLNDRHIRQLLLLGEFINADQALSMGLVNQVVEPENLMQEAMNIANIILKNSPNALAKTKMILDGLTGDFEKDMKRSVIEGQKVRVSKEAKEGMTAFLENRKPNW